MHLQNHLEFTHKTKPSKEIEKKKYKKVPKAQSHAQKFRAGRAPRVHIAKSKWPELIRSYQESMMNGVPPEDWGMENKVKNPVKTISRWKGILRKKKSS